MSDFQQSGLHPDADQINAFVEHALPPHEREQTLAHLAVCPDCRLVVSLSLPPVDESAFPQPEPVHRPWFLGWNLAWPVVAALAALIPLILYIHRTETTRSRTAAPAELATSHPPAPPLVPVAPARQSPPAAPAKAANRPVPPAAAAEKRSASPPLPGPAEREAATDEMSFVSPPPARGPQPAPANPANGFSGVLGGLAQARAKAAPGNSGIYGGTGQTNLNRNYVEGVPAAPPPPPPLPPPPEAAASAGAANETVTVNSGAPMLDTSDAVLGGVLSENTFQALPLPAALPSGLPILSTTASGRLVLALDTRNTLFFSDDGGRRWRPVPSQWKGRAVKVDLANPPAVQARAATQAAGAGAAMSSLAGFAGSELKVVTPTPNAAVAGTITDPTGAVIPNASVVVTDAARQTVRSAKTGLDGRYRLDGLAPGDYRIEASAPGFEKFDLPVTLAPAQQSLANLKLQVGAATEAVTVTAAPAIALEEPAPTLAVKKKAAAAAAPVQPAPLFEITTESGDRWTSPDGQTWTRRQTSR